MTNIALTGVPRGGTTLACRLLGDCIDSVALFEPMQVAKVPADDALACTLEFFANARSSLLKTGCAPSKLVEGHIPDNPFRPADAHGKRSLLATESLLQLPSPPQACFTLTVKHNAFFTALIPELQQAVRMIAIIRNPLAVLASWHSLELPVSLGRLPAGERLDPSLANELSRSTDIIGRQLTILDWFFRRYASLPAGAIVRYESIIETNGRCLFERAGVSNPRMNRRLTNQNQHPACRREVLPMLMRRLLAYEGQWRNWYSDASIEKLYTEITED